MVRKEVWLVFGGGELRSRLGLSVPEEFMQLVLTLALNVLYQIKFLLTARLLSLPNLSIILKTSNPFALGYTIYV